MFGTAALAQLSCFKMMEMLKEGEDYYVEDGLMVLTARYLLRRGYCCEQGCRNCPYGFVRRDDEFSREDAKISKTRRRDQSI